MVEEVIPHLVTEEENRKCILVPLGDDVKDVVFSMDKDSALDVDGFNGVFFQHCWDIVVSDLNHAIRDFFSNGSITHNLSSNFIVPISKTLGAMKVEQFHHIVLGNFVFKIITKIIANRLGFIATWIISPNQFGFIKGLQIQECKALASDWLNCLDKHSYGGNVGLKLDIRKTLDTMRWNFIISVLRVFGAFLNWVHNPFNSNWSSILFNGSSVR